MLEELHVSGRKISEEPQVHIEQKWGWKITGGEKLKTLKKLLIKTNSLKQ